MTQFYKKITLQFHLQNPYIYQMFLRKNPVTDAKLLDFATFLQLLSKYCGFRGFD